jgi:soluble lytic murein transglycosylase-like protein
MKHILFYLVFLGVLNISQARENDFFKSEFLNEQDNRLFIKELDILKTSPEDFNIKVISSFKTESYKKALLWIYVIYFVDKKSSLILQNKIKFTDLTGLYFATPALPKRDIIYKKIREYIKGYKIMPSSSLKEAEDIIWFSVITEDEKFINYLSVNKLSVTDFIDIIKQKRSFILFQNIVLTPENRISELLWQGLANEALPLIEELSPDSEARRTFLARIYFQTRNEKYKIYAKTLVEKEDFRDDGFVYDYIRYLRKTNHYKSALSLITQSKINYNNPHVNKMWDSIEELFRVYLDLKEYDKAYAVVSGTKFNVNENFALYQRAEFLSGFTALRFLKDYKKAMKHFRNIYESKNSNSYTKARGAYFMARAYRETGQKEMERKWLLIASKNINTFYGILALDTLNDVEPVYLMGLKSFTENRIKEAAKQRDEVHKFYFDSLLGSYYKENLHLEEMPMKMLKNNTNFKIGLIMLANSRFEDAKSFFALSVSDMSEKETKLAFDIVDIYLKKNKILTASSLLTTLAGKAANQGALIAESYGILDFILLEQKIKPNALIHAIIKQESNFVLRAISGPGAIGLMQVMPGTGKEVSRSAGMRFDVWRLKNDYKYNIQIGAFYLDFLLKKFDGSYPLALAAYNAGPNKVIEWQKRYFDPTKPVEMIDFIELIPFKETREYVFRVMENEVFYNYLLNNHTGSDTILMLQKKDLAFKEFLASIPKRTPPKPTPKLKKKAPPSKNIPKKSYPKALHSNSIKDSNIISLKRVK